MSTKGKLNRRGVWSALLCVFVLFALAGCKDESEEAKTSKHDRISMEKNAFITKEDGWVYQLALICPDKNKDEYNEVLVSGYNVKYKTIEGSHATVTDKEGNVIGQGSRTAPYAADFPDIREQMLYTMSYLNGKHFENEITVNELSDYQSNLFTKEEIANAFNTAIVRPAKKLGSYSSLPSVNCLQMQTDSNEIFQVSYITDYGDLGVINIEYMNENNERLSDKVINGQANEAEINAQKKIDAFEQEIIKKQSTTVEHHIKLAEHFDEKLDDTLNHIFADSQESAK